MSTSYSTLSEDLQHEDDETTFVVSEQVELKPIDDKIDETLLHDEESEQEKSPTFKEYIKSKRFQIMILLWFAEVICFLDRSNISIAIIEMGKEYTALNDPQNKGYILSSFFYGYVFTQILGGYLATKFGGKVVLGTGVVLWSLFTVLSAPTASILWLLLLSRALIGLGEGVTFPSMHHLNARWFPIRERSRVTTFMSSGGNFGTILSMFFIPFIMSSFGWRSIFYLCGALGFIWFIFFQWVASPSPETSKNIARNELSFIKQHRSELEAETKIPWKKIMTASAVWAIIATHTSYNFGYYILISWLPTFFTQKLHVSVENLSYCLTIPYIAMVTMGILSGWSADYLITRKKVPVVMVRKLHNSIALFLPIIFFLHIAYMDSDSLVLNMVFLTTAMGLSAVSKSSYWVNHLDIAPSYSGVLLGITNTFASIPGFVGNLMTGWILGDGHSWGAVFVSISVMNFVGGLVFLLFAKGNVVITR